MSEGPGAPPSVVESQVGAGFQAIASGDWRGARDAFSAVLGVAEVPEAYFGLANALFWLGDLVGTIANCEKAYAGFRRRGDAMFAAGAALSLVGYNKGYLGNTAAARGWLSRAARIIDNEVPQLRGELLGATAYVTDDPIESEALARQAVEIGRADGNPGLELMALHAVGQALVQQGRTEEGMSLLDEAMAGVVGGEGADPLTVAQMSCMTMVVCGSCFDLERATQWIQSLQGFIDRYGCPFLYADCRTYYGRVLFENGDWPAAEASLTEAISISRGVFAAPHAFAAGTLAELRLAQGRIEDAERLLRGVEAREEAAAAVASVHLQRGEPSAAAAVLRRRLAATSPDRLDVAAVSELLGEAEIAQGDGDAAAERARVLVALGTANGCDLIVAHGERLLGHALASSDAGAASAHLETALAAFVRAGIPYRAAQTRLLLARVLGPGDREVAGAEARVALSVFEDLGAGRDADAAAALMRDLGVKAARTGPRNVGRLTKREQEVLALLGEGLSNPGIAERLFLSRKTVEHHVARILSKLALRGRAEAAALAARAARDGHDEPGRRHEEPGRR
ncbi:MAG TPA: LuxR C-terminal-related transcriptional regulator [Micromonosporaceae bacterium]|nr:LuxR C-terminal-related transcriptional regulator [Micromonosporaceae bacterium]